jgi:hypothetical protein
MSTFTHFSELPLEIREMVWERIIPRRVISIRGIGRLAASDKSLGMGRLAIGPGYSGPLRLVIWGKLSPPKVLQVCREAREVALKHYIQFERYEHGYEGERHGIAYISPSYDMIFLYCHPVGSNVYWALEGLGPDLDKIESLAFDLGFRETCRHKSNIYTILRSRFPRLRELIFVLHRLNLRQHEADAVVLLEFKPVSPAYPHRTLFDEISNYFPIRTLFEEISNYYPSPPNIVNEFKKYPNNNELDNQDEIRKLRAGFDNLGPILPWNVCMGAIDFRHDTMSWVCIRKL